MGILKWYKEIKSRGEEGNKIFEYFYNKYLHTNNTSYHIINDANFKAEQKIFIKGCRRMYAITLRKKNNKKRKKNPIITYRARKKSKLNANLTTKHD